MIDGKKESEKNDDGFKTLATWKGDTSAISRGIVVDHGFRVLHLRLRMCVREAEPLSVCRNHLVPLLVIGTRDQVARMLRCADDDVAGCL